MPDQSTRSLHFVLLLSIVLGCGGPVDSPDSGTLDEDLALLKALPYADVDDAGDDERASVAHRDPTRSWDGINLYTNRRTEAYLMDMDGRRLHTWYLPAEAENCGYFELITRGEIIALCKERWLLRLDRESKVLWKTEVPVHHDFHLLDDGSIAVLIKEEWRQYKGRTVQFGGLVRLSGAGEVLEKWLAFEHLDELKPFHPESKLERPQAAAAAKAENSPAEGVGEEDPGKDLFDYYHWNTLEILPDTPLGRKDERFRAGNLLVCPRNVDSIMVLDQDSMRPVWSWGRDRLSMPHMPTMLPNGHILIFDNGVKTRRSRILEIDPPSGEIVWKYPQGDQRGFLSISRGSNQRLPNGNTLILASDRGYAFEVTPEGDRVWEFWNPDRRNGKRKAIYRLLRLPRQEVAERMRVPAG